MTTGMATVATTPAAASLEELMRAELMRVDRPLVSAYGLREVYILPAEPLRDSPTPYITLRFHGVIPILGGGHGQVVELNIFVRPVLPRTTLRRMGLEVMRLLDELYLTNGSEHIRFKEPPEQTQDFPDEPRNVIGRTVRAIGDI